MSHTGDGLLWIIGAIAGNFSDADDHDTGR